MLSASPGLVQHLFFSSCLPLSILLAASSQWPVSKALFCSLRLLSHCVYSVLGPFPAISEDVILLCSKRNFKDDEDEVVKIVGLL